VQIDDIPAAHRILKREFEKGRAPIIELIQAQTKDPFKVLVATILSSRTKDETTAAATRRLFAEVETLEDLQRISQEKLEKLIFPVGFYRVKSKQLKALPKALEKHFDGIIPSTVEELCALPGVGRKTANLVVSVAFNLPAICVDVHVHRISNRMGLLRTKTPLDTEMTLRKILPKRYWQSWNRFLVSFGQTICKPVGPQCNGCPLHPHCDRVGVK
jgi:endonuclease III